MGNTLLSLDIELFATDGVLLPIICKGKAPLKVASFCWITAHEACSAQSKLQRRGIMLCSKCYICEENEEEVNHLFIHCKAVWKLWCMFFSLYNLKWALLKTVKELAHCWNGRELVRENSKTWMTIPAYLFWIYGWKWTENALTA